MTAFLQRLLDRAAGMAPAGDAMLARPLLQSQSPVVAFDQRLADPALAGDFGIVGAAPEPMDSPEIQAEATPADTPAATPPVPTPARERGAHRPATDETPAAIAREIAAAIEPVAALPARNREPFRAADAAPLPHQPVRDAPAAIGAAPSVPSRPIAHTDRDLPPLDEPAARAPARPASPAVKQAALAAIPVPPSHSQAYTADPAPAVMPRNDPPSAIPALAVPAAFAAPVPPLQQAAIPARAAAPALDRPIAAMAEPVHTPAAPLPPVTTGPSRAEIERIVQEVLAATPAPPAPAAQQREAGADPVRRPASAAEASVIGKLEPSGFRPMLFGVRRR